MRIFIFGDSIAQGFYDTEGGWIQRLTRLYNAKSLSNMMEGNDEFVEIFNLGVSGDTAEGVSSRMPEEIKRRRLYDTDEAIVIAIGLNDTILRDNRAQQDMEDFQQTIERLIDVAQKQTPRVLFVGLSPVKEELTDPWKFSSSGKQWKNNRIDLFEDVIKQSTLRKGIAFVPIYDMLFDEMHKGTEIHSDGLHLNDTGHGLIADVVKPQLERLLI